MKDLVADKSGFRIQAFTLVSGQINKTSGTYNNVVAVCCAEDAVITIHGESVSLTAGMIFGIPEVSVTVVSGKIHWM